MGKRKRSRSDFAVRFTLFEAVIGEYDYQIINFIGVETNDWDSSLLCFVKDFDDKRWILGDILFIGAVQCLTRLVKNHD